MKCIECKKDFKKITDAVVYNKLYYHPKCLWSKLDRENKNENSHHGIR